MSVDPLQLIINSRPRVGDVPGAGEGVVATRGEVRRASGLHQPGDLSDLSALPGSPGYAAKMAAIQRQTLAQGDPEEIRAMQQPLILPQGPVPPPETEPLPILTPPTKRVAIYYGKNDTYNVAVEGAPDWDTVKMFKALNEDSVRLLLDMAASMGAKTTDKTGDFS